MTKFIKEIWLTILFDLKSVIKAIQTVVISAAGCILCVAIFFAPFVISIILEDWCLHHNVDTSGMFISQVLWLIIAMLVFQTIGRMQKKKTDSDKPKLYQVHLTYSSHEMALQQYYGYGPTDKKDILRDYFVDGVRHILRAQYCINAGNFQKHVQVFACHKDDLSDLTLDMKTLNTPVKVVPEGRQLKSDFDLYVLKDSKSLLDTIDTGDWVIVILNHGLLAGYIEVVEADNVQH